MTSFFIIIRRTYSFYFDEIFISTLSIAIFLLLSLPEIALARTMVAVINDSQIKNSFTNVMLIGPKSKSKSRIYDLLSQTCHDGDHNHEPIIVNIDQIDRLKPNGSNQNVTTNGKRFTEMSIIDNKVLLQLKKDKSRVLNDEYNILNDQLSNDISTENVLIRAEMNDSTTCF